MFYRSSHSTKRQTSVFFLLLALLINLLPAAPSLARTSLKGSRSAKSLAPSPQASLVHTLPQPDAAVESFVRVLNLQTNDIVFNAQTQKIHASVPSSAGTNGNSITEVDPVGGTVGQSVFIGSEPNKLALSDDGQVLYASLDGAAAVRRFDIPTHTAGPQFSLGADPFSGPYLAADLAVAPGNSTLLAVARTRPNVSPPGSGVAIFDNGVQRPVTSPGHSDSAAFLAFSSSASTLYGSTLFNGGLQTLSIDSSGVTLASTTPFSVAGDIQFQNGIVYNGTGKKIDPSTNTLLGTFAGVGTGPFVVDYTSGRAYYMIGNTTGLNQTVTVKGFDINTFLSVGEITISGVNGSATSMVRWGTNGLAFRTSGSQIFLIQTSLIPSPDPIPPPTPTPTATPTPSPTPVELSVRQIALSTKDLIYNDSNQTIYSSLPSTAGSMGNSIAAVNPTTGTVGSTVFVGSEPNKLALSEDGQSLYVGLDGAGSVRRFDTSSQTAGLQFYLEGGNSQSGPYIAGDLAVMPGSPSTVVVARTNGSDSSIAVYDNGARRPITSNGAGTDIEFGASPARIYSGNIARHSISASGISFESSASVGNGGKLKFAGGLLYTANGSVIDPEPGVLKGTFTATGVPFNSIMTVDAALGRAYFLTIQSGVTGVLRVYDINTFVPLGQVTISNIPGANQFSSLVRWGENGLAFRTATHVMLIQSSLINPSGSVPAATPTPGVTPTPSPTPQATTFGRLVDVPVNDVVYQQASGTLYASVPSSGGARGNSITAVTAATAALGQSVFIGSEPNRLALSDDGQVLYAGLGGANAIRRFDISTQSPGIQFTLGTDPNFGLSFFANDIAVTPGNSNTIAVARHASASPPEGGVAIFDNGVIRPTTTPGHIVASSYLAFANPTTLYGGGFDSGLNTMAINGSGVSIVSTTPYHVGYYIEYKNGLVYSSRGQVINPVNGALVGSFTNVASFSTAMTVDVALGKIFFASGSGNNLIISAYDINTFLPLGQVTLPFPGTPTRLVRWGINGLAVRVFTNSANEGQLYLIQSALVSGAAPIPTGVQFSLSNGFFVSESSGRADVQVIRTGDLSVSSSINYATSDGTANERSDYTTALGTLRFAPGESSKTFTVFVTNDVYQEAAETINLTLSNPVGTLLVSPDKSLLTIQNDDFSPPTANPIDSTSFFVRQHYRDFLNRDPDAAGLQFWSNEINSCVNDLQCRELKRINVSAAFFLSIEFQETGYLAYRMYKVAYGDTTSPNVILPVPVIRFREFLSDAQRLGQGVQVGIGDWQTKLETNKTEYAREFVLTQRFLAAYPLTMTPTQFVEKLDQNAGGVLSVAERDQLIAELAAASNVAQARASVTRKVAEDADLNQRELNRAFVLMQYYGYLRRNPDDPQDTDFRGWEFWVNKLNSFNGNFVSAEMVKAFLDSTEYRQRFAP